MLDFTRYGLKAGDKGQSYHSAGLRAEEGGPQVAVGSVGEGKGAGPVFVDCPSG